MVIAWNWKIGVASSLLPEGEPWWGTSPKTPTPLPTNVASFILGNKVGIFNFLGGGACVSASWGYLLWWASAGFFSVNVGNPQVNYLLMYVYVYIYIWIHNTSVSASLAKKKKQLWEQISKNTNKVLSEIERLGLPLLSCLRENLGVGDFSKPPAPSSNKLLSVVSSFLAMNLEFLISLEGGHVCLHLEVIMVGMVCWLHSMLASPVLLWWAWYVGCIPSFPMLASHRCTISLCIYIYEYKIFLFLPLWQKGALGASLQKFCLSLFVLPVVAFELWDTFPWQKGALGARSQPPIAKFCLSLVVLPYVCMWLHTSVSVSLANSSFGGKFQKPNHQQSVVSIYLFFLLLHKMKDTSSLSLPTKCCLLPLPLLARKLGFSTSLGACVLASWGYYGGHWYVGCRLQATFMHFGWLQRWPYILSFSSSLSHTQKESFGDF